MALNKQNLIAEEPLLLSEPFFVSEVVNNVLIETPIRVIGTVSTVNDSSFVLEHDGEKLVVQFTHVFDKELIDSKDLLIEGIIKKEKNLFITASNRLLVLSDD